MSQTRRTFVAGAAAFSFAAGRAPAFAQQKLTPIRIVVTPVTNYTGLLVGRDKGWFEEQGLNVSWSPVAQTAIAVEATYGGSVEFAGGGVLEPMIARGNGLDMMLVRAECAHPAGSAGQFGDSGESQQRHSEAC